MPARPLPVARPGRTAVRAALALAALLAVAGPTPAPAEESRSAAWRLPEHGAALYDRVHDVRGGRGVGLLDGRPRAAVLFQGELAPGRTHVGAPLHDLRDLPLWIAADLRRVPTGGEIDWTFEGAFGLGPHRVVGRVGAQAPDGTQPVLARVAPSAEGEAGRSGGVTGTVRLVRRVDAVKGRLDGFESRFAFSFTPAARSAAEPVPPTAVEIEESWTLREVLAPGEARFRLRVAEAIQRSATALRDELAAATFSPGSPLGPAVGEKRASSQASGYLALALLAVLKSEHFDDDRAVKRALASLRGREIETTYSLACAIMAIEAAHAPHGERDRLMRDPTARPATRPLDATDRAVVERWTRALLDAHDTRVDPGYCLRWRYRRSTSYDNSNTQYALLGLYSAHLCGVEIPRFVWESAAAHWLDDAAEVDGGPVHPSVVTHAEREREAAGEEGRTRARGPRVRPLAWGYVGPNAPTGSMTAGGVSSLTIAHAAARDGRGLGGGLGPMAEKAIRGGMAWLSEHFTVRRNPGARPVLWTHLYYLYSLERALELNKVALLEGRDWYFEGAVWLLETQQEDGRWNGAPEETAFGLLFLKKAVPPVVTPTR